MIAILALIAAFATGFILGFLVAILLSAAAMQRRLEEMERGQWP